MGGKTMVCAMALMMTGCFGGGSSGGAAGDGAAGDGAGNDAGDGAGNSARSGAGDDGQAGTIITTGGGGEGEAGTGTAGVSTGGVGAAGIDGGKTSSYDDCSDHDDCSEDGESCYDPTFAPPVCSGCEGCDGDAVPVAQCIYQPPCPEGVGQCPAWVCYDVLDRDCGGSVEWCGDPCKTSADCPADWMACNDDGTCSDPNHCSNSGECPSNTECDPDTSYSNGCVKIACNSDADCDDFCVFDFCHDTPGSCQLPPEPCLAP